ncbi:MAG: hypothetical protein ONA90_09885 [candidate division KSB1 bacterium]|nr:hypothetical protein [candidate division KSB1 bacterium]
MPNIPTLGFDIILAFYFLHRRENQTGALVVMAGIPKIVDDNADEARSSLKCHQEYFTKANADDFSKVARFQMKTKMSLRRRILENGEERKSRNSASASP